jgi:hypothetical protein
MVVVMVVVMVRTSRHCRSSHQAHGDQSSDREGLECFHFGTPFSCKWFSYTCTNAAGPGFADIKSEKILVMLT